MWWQEELDGTLRQVIKLYLDESCHELLLAARPFEKSVSAKCFELKQVHISCQKSLSLHNYNLGNVSYAHTTSNALRHPRPSDSNPTDTNRDGAFLQKTASVPPPKFTCNPSLGSHLLLFNLLPKSIPNPQHDVGMDDDDISNHPRRRTHYLLLQRRAGKQWPFCALSRRYLSQLRGCYRLAAWFCHLQDSCGDRLHNGEGHADGMPHAQGIAFQDVSNLAHSV